MIRALRHDFEEVRSTLLRYGLELTLAGELLACRSGITERNATEIANRCLAVTRLASLIESTGLELPKYTIALEADWHRDRIGSSIPA